MMVSCQLKYANRSYSSLCSIYGVDSSMVCATEYVHVLTFCEYTIIAE
jgi:hypothetical protein